MKTTPSGRSTSHSFKSVLPWHLCLAGTFLGFCFGLGILLLSARTESATNFRLPPGQLQADTRTVFAALHFLLDNEAAIESSPTAVSDRVSIAGGMLRATVPPCEMLACRSNQAELNCETCCTNPPVRG